VIPRANIVAWRSVAPWLADSQVEQDLVLSRVLVEVFSNTRLAENLAFRGGTALYKLHLPSAWRYSEDIDFVQIQSGAIGTILNEIRWLVDPFLGNPTRDLKEDSVVLNYRFSSEIPPVVPLRLKVEINTREHFSVMGIEKRSYSVQSNWFSGVCELSTYSLEELLGTKLRALYQRRKGRDLFDLWVGLTDGHADNEAIVRVFKHYMDNGGYHVTQEEFRENLHDKMGRRDFLGDTEGLLRPGVTYDPQKAFQLIDDRLINLI
jgi:predicted nucleotidyltransferase component of viral defense system